MIVAQDNSFTQRLVQFAIGAALAIAIIYSARAAAAVTDQAPNGFTVSETAHIAAPSAEIYAALLRPQDWWDSKHTFSGSAANMSLDPRAGGCWCETLPNGGSVLHMTVVFVDPNKTLRLRGALGPFQAMGVESVLTWSLAPGKDGTAVTLVNVTGGYASGGFDRFAKAADGVLAIQIAHLKQFVETGSADTRETKP